MSDQRRGALLAAIGIDRYVRRRGPNDRPNPRDGLGQASDGDLDSLPTARPSRPPPPPPETGPRIKAATDPRGPPYDAGVARPSPLPTVPVPDVTGYSWAQLQAHVDDCERCDLCKSRTRTVFGVGDPAARWMVVGEAPGADEDRQGEPFVGRAGQLLNAMLRAAGHPRDSVYIANVLKCRPPANRDPQPEEVRRCLPTLQRQIELVNPDLVLCVGRVAAQSLLGVDQPLAQLRGKVHRLGPGGRPVVVTYHPAYLLRSPSEKRKAWADLKFAIGVNHGSQP